MAVLRGLYRAGRAYVKKKSIERLIREHDAGVNVHAGFPGFAFHKGWVDAPPLDEPRQFDAYGNHISHHISAELARIAVPVIRRLQPTITHYLGSGCRLDDISLFWYQPARAHKPMVSGSWHDDNCGHRLKLFICLKGDGNTPTVFLPESHRQPYRFRYSDLLRFMGFSNKASRDGEVFLRYQGGDVALFDTNGLHRGQYESPASERAVILVEFMDRQKSNAISGHAPCGPGSSPTGEVLLDPEAYALLASTGLMDGGLTAPRSGLVSYSLSHLAKHPEIEKLPSHAST